MRFSHLTLSLSTALLSGGTSKEEKATHLLLEPQHRLIFVYTPAHYD